MVELADRERLKAASAPATDRVAGADNVQAAIAEGLGAVARQRERQAVEMETRSKQMPHRQRIRRACRRECLLYYSQWTPIQILALEVLPQVLSRHRAATSWSLVA